MAMIPALQLVVLAVAVAHAGRAGRGVGRRCRSTGRPGRTCGTAPRPWTPWSRSARWPRSAGRCTRCSSAAPGCPASPTRSTSRCPGPDGSSQIYLEVAAGVVTFVLAGRYAEAKARRRSGAALRALLTLAAKDAVVLRDGREVRVPADQLLVGDRFVVRPGEKIAADGVVVEGSSALDLSMINGEPLPVDVADGCRGQRRLRGRRRPAGGAGHPGRRGHPAGPDGRAGRGGADPQGRGAAAGRPGVRAVRARWCSRWPRPPGGSGSAPGPARPMAVDAATAVLIVACPCALGPGHPDRAAGRHRPRGPARHPDHRPGGAGVHPPDRHRSCWTRPAPSPAAR